MMTTPVSDIAFSPAVKAAQQQRGSRDVWSRMEQRGGWQSTITEELAEFISRRDSLYLGTASHHGQPYIQHRGGPTGFLKVLNDRTLALADYTGNSQYISVGNLDENDQAFIFLMDYPNRRRIKIWGRARYVEDDPGLLQQLSDPDYRGRPERALLFDVVAWDVNCPQHIRPRWTDDELESVVGNLQQRVRELERDNRNLLAALQDANQELPERENVQ